MLAAMDTPLKLARIRSGHTQEALAAMVDTTKVTISRVERCRASASRGLAERLAKALGLTEEQILYPERFATAKRGRKARPPRTESSECSA